MTVGNGRTELTVVVNGEPTTLVADPGRPLVDLLREDLGLTGPRLGCRNGDCGACTVLLDGEPCKACLLPSARADGRAVTTLEGLAADGQLHPVQEAFWQHNAFQCGFCLSGQVLCAVALLRRDPDPDDGAIDAALAGNICRCTGYQQIRTAVREAAAGAADEGSPPGR